MRYEYCCWEEGKVQQGGKRERLVRYEYCCWEEGKVQQGGEKESDEIGILLLGREKSTAGRC